MTATDQISHTSTTRHIIRVLKGQNAADGAGVRLRRYIGGGEQPMLDPFLLLDVFRSDQPEDYIAGFPPHPHRGFETVTYLLAGRMRHRDNAGHQGVVKAGGVQWMSAGRGIEHSEMPEQEQGLLHGFQLWVNLPAKEKMSAPRYQEFEPDAVPVEHRDGADIRVIAGQTGNGTVGVIASGHTHPLFWDIHLAPGANFSETVPSEHQGFVFIIEGEVDISWPDRPATLSAGTLGVLSGGNRISLASPKGARLLLIAAAPLGEPVARHGPFVMNTREELFHAYEDYRSGRFGRSI